MTEPPTPERAGQGAGQASIGPGAYVARAARLGAGVVIGPNAVVLADEEGMEPATVVEHGASVGANATILSGVTVGFEARIGPGSVVTRSVPPRAIAEGNPATIVGYVDADPGRPSLAPPHPTSARSGGSRVRGVGLQDLRNATDIRGTLAVAEVGSDIPFPPKRCFLVYGVPSAETRGQHAHRMCDQLLVAVNGSLRVVADDGAEREEFILDRPTSGLYLPAMTWSVQYGYSADAVLLVLASDLYDPGDYIRDYAEFLAIARATVASS